MMKKLAIVALAATTLTTGVLANDKFAGPWVGAAVGVGMSHGDLTLTGETDITTGEIDGSSLGFIGGVHAGWDWVFKERWLLGLELLAELSSIDGKSSIRSRDTEEGDTVLGRPNSANVDMDWSVGASARGGYIIGTTLIYLHAGWIGSNWDISSVREGSGVRKDDKFLSGFRTGVGFDTMLTDHVSFGGEWAYTWYSDVDVVSNDNTDPVTKTKYDPETSVFRVNLKVKFKGIY